MKQNTPCGFLNSRGVNIALGILLVLNWLCIGLGIILFGFSYLAWSSYQSLYRQWEFESEKNVREWIVPRLVQENGLKECPVKHAAFGCTHFKIDAASPDQYGKITEDVTRLEQETRKDRKWHSSFILEFDHDKPGHGISVFLYTGDQNSSGMFDQWRTDRFWRSSVQ
jgi:hypothetical protein